MIELGGKIALEGFDKLDSAEVLVAKKLVGSYVRSICDNVHCERAVISLEPHTQFTISVKAIIQGETTAQSASKDNLFMAMDAALKNLLSELDIKL